MGALTLIVGAVSLVPATLAVVLRARVPTAVTGCLAHAAAVGLAVAVCSSDRLSPYTTWLLQKRSDGHISPVSRLLFWPYHAGLRGKLWVQRRKSTEPLFDQVTEQLYIGGWPEQVEWLPEGQPSVLDVTCELPRTHHNRYLNLPCWDTQAPNAAQIQHGVEWTIQELGEGRSCYVHCAHGHGRSATVLAAVLMATGKAKTAEEAVAVMRAVRPRVRLNKQQAAALTSWIAGYYAGGSSSNKGSGTHADQAQVLLSSADGVHASGTPKKRSATVAQV
eukprot:GHRQ01021239.1.p1 GENE.GHRQ01021239.1~~GHRQ01021239.1.p1  ORF type:complete len:277 (+),score=60.15 GHRQ01021239.1:556-1386(+)